MKAADGAGNSKYSGGEITRALDSTCAALCLSYTGIVHRCTHPTQHRMLNSSPNVFAAVVTVWPFCGLRRGVYMDFA
jgi:hypothetical protein